jgi:hypothetical protein
MPMHQPSTQATFREKLLPQSRLAPASLHATLNQPERAAQPMSRRPPGLRVPSWVSRAATALWKTPFTASYAILLAITDVIMTFLSSTDQTAVAQATSTNITHLALDPLLVLPASGVVDLGNSRWMWIPLTLLLLGGIERRLGSGRTVMVTFGAHVIASLLSEGVLLVQIASHLQPRSDVNILDVGPSYMILAALSGCLVIGSWRLRAGAFVIGGLIVPGLMVRLPELDMSAVGHLISIVLGASFAGYLASARSREQAAALREAATRAAAATRRLGELPVKERVTA